MFVVCLVAAKTVLSVTDQDGGLMLAHILISMVMVVIRVGMVSVYHVGQQWKFDATKQQTKFITNNDDVCWNLCKIILNYVNNYYWSVWNNK